jgi:hypothetical protein
MQHVTTHQAVAGDALHAGITIAAENPGPGGGCQDYTLMRANSAGHPMALRLMFVRAATEADADPLWKGGQPVTNEVLLAIVQHRLEGFQKGPFACTENDVALHHVRAALEHLQVRTRRRLELGVEGKMENHETTPAVPAGPVGRVRVDADSVYIGDKALVRGKLNASWGYWSEVQSAVLALNPPVTYGEMAVLGSLAVTPAAKHGFNELISALRTLSKPRV